MLIIDSLATLALIVAVVALQLAIIRLVHKLRKRFNERSYERTAYWLRKDHPYHDTYRRTRGTHLPYED